MLIDAFPYAYGPEVLLLRLHELAEVVDLHVLVEADVTHTGAPRSWAWPELREDPRFAPFLHKVRWETACAHGAADVTPWQREEWIRDQVLIHALSHATPDDLILFSDHDEIPHPSAIRRVLDAAESGAAVRARLFGAYHEWFLNLRASPPNPIRRWEFRQPLIFRADDPLVQDDPAVKRTGSRMRADQFVGVDGWSWDQERPVAELGKFDPSLRGWHMTLQGGAGAVHAKLSICAHTELQTLSQAQIERMIDGRTDILGRCRLRRCPAVELPRALNEHPELWRGMVMS